MSASDDLLLSVAEDDKKGRVTKVLASVLALFLTVGLLGGFFYLRGRNERTLAARQASAEQVNVNAPPEAQVFQDEARLEGGRGIIGGTVRNISGATLENVSVEIELRKRVGQETEVRSVEVKPPTLPPGETGKYSLQIASKIWGGAKVLRLQSAGRERGVPFKPEAGAPRPAEARPSPKVVVAPRPKPKGGDFINTPDTPIRIP